MRAVLIFAVAAMAAPIFASSAFAHDAKHYSAGEPGDPRKASRPVLVTMRETDDGRMIYVPASVEVRQGEQVRFVISNAGAIPHEFMLASTEDNLKHGALMQKFPDMEHDDPNGKTVPPKGKAEMLWKFSKAGTFEFSCLIPGHREAGMIGAVSVK